MKEKSPRTIEDLAKTMKRFVALQKELKKHANNYYCKDESCIWKIYTGRPIYFCPFVRCIKKSS